MKKIVKSSIKYWAEDDRPREKLLKKGIRNLSNAELIAILIGSGSKDESAVDLSKRILLSVENNLDNLARMTIPELKRKFKGIGTVKAINILTALEIAKRRKQSKILEKPIITSSKDVYDYFYPTLNDLPYEEFWILLLNRSNKIIESIKLSQGSTNAAFVDIKLIMKMALDKLASSIIICHNHPSGNLKPGNNDILITKKIKTAAQTFDINLLDHLIVSNKGFYSFADENNI